jgi:hypothetical protein
VGRTQVAEHPHEPRQVLARHEGAERSTYGAIRAAPRFGAVREADPRDPERTITIRPASRSPAHQLADSRDLPRGSVTRPPRHGAGRRLNVRT